MTKQVDPHPKAAALSIGDIVTFKANIFTYRAAVNSVEGNRFKGTIVESPHKGTIGRFVDMHCAYIWTEPPVNVM